jgi:hypothetical protein
LIKGIQVLGIVIGLYLVLTTYLEYRNGKATVKRTIIFTGLWSMMILFFINTRLVNIFMPLLSTESNVLTALVVGVLILFVLYLDTYKQLNNIEKNLDLLIQNLALKKYQDDKKENPVE